MATPSESADLLIKLYELRRDPALRSARDWFFNRFHPASAEEVLAVLLGTESAPYRMVTTYWEMAASFVSHGAIDAEMFHDANTEHVAVIAKLGPFLPELRRLAGWPTLLLQLESVVMAMPDAEMRLSVMRNYLGVKKKQMEAATSA